MYQDILEKNAFRGVISPTPGPKAVMLLGLRNKVLKRNTNSKTPQIQPNDLQNKNVKMMKMIGFDPKNQNLFSKNKFYKIRNFGYIKRVICHVNVDKTSMQKIKTKLLHLVI